MKKQFKSPSLLHTVLHSLRTPFPLLLPCWLLLPPLFCAPLVCIAIRCMTSSSPGTRE